MEKKHCFRSNPNQQGSKKEKNMSIVINLTDLKLHENKNITVTFNSEESEIFKKLIEIQKELYFNPLRFKYLESNQYSESNKEELEQLQLEQSQLEKELEQLQLEQSQLEQLQLEQSQLEQSQLEQLQLEKQLEKQLEQMQLEQPQLANRLKQLQLANKSKQSQLEKELKQLQLEQSQLKQLQLEQIEDIKKCIKKIKQKIQENTQKMKKIYENDKIYKDKINKIIVIRLICNQIQESKKDNISEEEIEIIRKRLLYFKDKHKDEDEQYKSTSTSNLDFFSVNMYKEDEDERYKTISILKDFNFHGNRNNKHK